MSRLRDATFVRRIFGLHPAQRFVVSVFSYGFLVTCIGLAIAFFISDIPSLHWVGALLVLMLGDYFLHVGGAHFSLSDFENGRVRNNNIALCLKRKAQRVLLKSLDAALVQKADFEMCLLRMLADQEGTGKALRRLEIDGDEFVSRITSDIRHGSAGQGTSVREAYLDRIRHIVIAAAAHAESHGKESIGVENLFCALIYSKHPRILRLLDFYSLEPRDVDVALVLGSSRRSVSPYLGGFAMRQGRVAAHRVNRSFTSRPTPLLDTFSLDVTDYVRDGKGGFLIGHEDTYDRMVDVLSRAGNRNVLLVGDPGVGKEALVYHLAYRIVTDGVPGPLYDRRVVQLSLSDMLSGSSGQEATGRLKRIAQEILEAGNILLYIPDAHLLEKSSAEGLMSLGDVFLPIIRSGVFPVVAATYPKEYKQFIDSRQAMADAFEVLHVQELSSQDAVKLLSYWALILEKKYRMKISVKAIVRAVALAAKYVRTKPLPASAQELLQETVVDALQRGEKWVRAEQITSVLERKLHIPVQTASGMEAKDLLRLEERIHERYIDQDEAVGAVSRALRAYRSGLGRNGGPIASFLFVGPTGVGKTELTKTLARLYFGSESLLIRFDMSEYQEKESIIRFIGSSDGKVAGQLTEAVFQAPYSVILLDEFEKANQDILNLFLQVFDEGRLTDSTGRVVDFSNSIIIATSNAHSLLVQQHVQRHGSIEGLTEELTKRLSEFFRPELINRFSDIIVFKPLSRDDIAQIVSLQVRALVSQVSEAQGITISVSSAAQEKLAHLGYSPAFGARPLRKVFDVRIRSLLSEKILAGELHRGDEVEITLDAAGEFIFS